MGGARREKSGPKDPFVDGLGGFGVGGPLNWPKIARGEVHAQKGTVTKFTVRKIEVFNLAAPGNPALGGSQGHSGGGQIHSGGPLPACPAPEQGVKLKLKVSLQCKKVSFFSSPVRSIELAKLYRSPLPLKKTTTTTTPKKPQFQSEWTSPRS